MVRVPGDPGPQVSLNALPDVGRVHAPSPWREVTNVLTKFDAAREEADNLRVEDQINRARVGISSLQDEASQVIGASILPKDGKTFTDVYMEKFGKIHGEAMGSLSNDRQKAMYSRRMAQIGASFQSVINTHEKEQIKNYSDSVDQGTVTIEAQNAGKNLGNLKELTIGQVRVNGAIDSLAKRNGWSPEKTQVEREKALSMFHGTVLETAMDKGKLDYAKTYLEQHGEEMNPETRAKAEEILKKRETEVSVMSAVDQVDAENLNYADKAKALRETFKDNPEAIHQAVAELGARKTQREVSKQEAEGELWDMYTGLNGGKRLSVRDIEKTSQWNALDGADRQRLSRAWEADAKRNAVGSGGGGNDGEDLAKFATFLQAVQDPVSLSKMSDAQIIGKYAGVLGSSMTKKVLLQKREASSSLDKLTKATVDATQFKDLAREYGLRVSDPGVKMGEEDQKTLGLLRDKTLDAIRARQMESGKELSQEEKESIIRRELKKVPLYKSRKTKYAFQLEGAWEIGATDDEKERAYNYLVKNGAPTTPENMWTMIDFLRNNK